jgi:hypothetical protein
LSFLLYHKQQHGVVVYFSILSHPTKVLTSSLLESIKFDHIMFL